MFQINGLLAFSEKDSFEGGCDPDTSTSWQVESIFKADTIKGVILEVAESLGIPEKDVKESVNIDDYAEDEPGRIDFCMTADEDNYPASESQTAQWKNGEIDLYYVIYMGYVEEIKPVDLSESMLD